jgi:hypothetical protein
MAGLVDPLGCAALRPELLEYRQAAGVGEKERNPGVLITGVPLEAF